MERIALRNGARAGRPTAHHFETKPLGAVPAQLVNRRADPRVTINTHKGPPAITIKQRLLSANKENGNYILSAFLGFQAPTGAPTFTNKAWLITSTIAGGKGWGDFDDQGTVSVPVPTANEVQSARRS